MIEQTTGNILEAKCEALVNTVNTFGVMGKGIALQFKQAFPANYELYRKACSAGAVVPGKMFVVLTNRLENPKFIINFPTKRHWKGKSKIEDIRSGLEDLVRVVKAHDISSIAIPPLGCGNGGLAWTVVSPLITAALADIPTVRALVYSPDGAPAVDDMPIATKKPKINLNRAALIDMMIHYGIPGYRLSLLEIQKLAYFLQLAGQPLRLNFVADKYGPYAEPLNFSLQHLEGHYIRGYGDRSSESSVHVLDAGREAARNYIADDNATADRIARVCEIIDGFETPHGLELLATVHWVITHHEEAKADPIATIDLVHRWNERKRRIFTEKQITVAHAHLLALQLDASHAASRQTAFTAH